MFTTLRDELDPKIAAISSMLIITSLAIAVTASVLGGRRRPHEQRHRPGVAADPWSGRVNPAPAP